MKYVLFCPTNCANLEDIQLVILYILKADFNFKKIRKSISSEIQRKVDDYVDTARHKKKIGIFVNK